MNRFRRRKEVRDGPSDSSSPFSLESEAPISSIPKKAFRLGKKTAEPEPKSEIDLASALPSSDNFRTSLLMNGLSARFSMLREQDDPNTKIGKASDDSVMFSKRVSRFNDFGFQAQGLSDIAEVSSVHSSLQAPREIGRAVSNASLPSYGTHGDLHSHHSIMNRSRPGEGNNLFGGRLKINVGNRVLYDDDVRLSAYQKQRRIERAQSNQDFKIQNNPTSILSRNFNTQNYCPPERSPLFADDNNTPTSINSSEDTGGRQDTASLNTGDSPELRTSKLRKLYEVGLDNHLHEQQFSAMSKIDTLTRRSATSTSPSFGPIQLNTSSDLRLWNKQNAAKQTSECSQGSITTMASSNTTSNEILPLSPNPFISRNSERQINSLQLNQSPGNLALANQRINLCSDEVNKLPKSKYSSENLISPRTKIPGSKTLDKIMTNRSRTPSNSTCFSKRSNSNSSFLGSFQTSLDLDLTLSHAAHFSLSSKDLSRCSQDTSSSRESFYSPVSLLPDTLNNSRLTSFDQSESPYRISIEDGNISPKKSFDHNQLTDLSKDFDSIDNPDSLSTSGNANSITEKDRPPPSEIIGMVRQHMRYESNASSIYESPPSTDYSKITSNLTNMNLQNEYLSQSNPWKGSNDDEKIAVPSKGNEDRILSTKVDLLAPPTNKCHISYFYSEELESSKVYKNSDAIHEEITSNDDLYLLSTKYDNGSCGDTNESSSIYSVERETVPSHNRQDSTDTQREQQNLKNELVSRRQHVQQKMKNFIESDGHSFNSSLAADFSKDGSSKNGVFGILRNKNSWGSVKPSKDNRSKTMKKLGLGTVTSSNGRCPKSLSGNEENDKEGLPLGSFKEATSQGSWFYGVQLNKCPNHWTGLNVGR